MNKPTKPGFYWYKHDDSSRWEPVWVLKSELGYLWAWGYIQDQPSGIDTFTGEWGPEILPPS